MGEAGTGLGGWEEEKEGGERGAEGEEEEREGGKRVAQGLDPPLGRPGPAGLWLLLPWMG